MDATKREEWLDKIKKVIKSPIASDLLWTIIKMIVVDVIPLCVKRFLVNNPDGFKLLEQYSVILPNLRMIVIAVVITVVASVAMCIFVRIKIITLECIRKISAVAFYVLVGFAAVHFMLIVSLANEKKDVLLPQIKQEVMLLFAIANVGFVYSLAHKLHMRCAKKTATKEFNDSLSGALDDVGNKIGDLSLGIEELLKKKDFDTAVTSTVIPFSKRRNKLITYLIANSSYPEFTWMFPGGHVMFNENMTPESIAVSRALDEANLNVKIIDAYGMGNQSSTVEKINNMKIFHPPHFLYLFELNKTARCNRERDHKFHLDIVYIAEVQKTPTAAVGQKRIAVSLPLTIEKLEDVSAECHKAVRDYYQNHGVTNNLRKPVSEYVERMLFDAYIKFKYNN